MAGTLLVREQFCSGMNYQINCYLVRDSSVGRVAVSHSVDCMFKSGPGQTKFQSNGLWLELELLKLVVTTS